MKTIFTLLLMMVMTITISNAQQTEYKYDLDHFKQVVNNLELTTVVDQNGFQLLQGMSNSYGTTVWTNNYGENIAETTVINTMTGVPDGQYKIYHYKQSHFNINYADPFNTGIRFNTYHINLSPRVYIPR